METIKGWIIFRVIFGMDDAGIYGLIVICGLF